MVDEAAFVILGPVQNNKQYRLFNSCSRPKAGKLKLRVAIVMVGFALSSTPAFAYLDPGEGSMLAQALFAAAAGGVVALKLYWNKIQG